VLLLKLFVSCLLKDLLCSSQTLHLQPSMHYYKPPINLINRLQPSQVQLQNLLY